MFPTSKQSERVLHKTKLKKEPTSSVHFLGLLKLSLLPPKVVYHVAIALNPFPVSVFTAPALLHYWVFWPLGGKPLHIWNRTKVLFIFQSWIQLNPNGFLAKSLQCMYPSYSDAWQP